MRQNKSIRRMLPLAAILCLVLSLCGCSKSESVKGEKVNISVSGIEGRTLKIRLSGQLLSEAELIYPETEDEEYSMLSVTKKTLTEKKAVFKVKASDPGLAGVEFQFINGESLVTTASVSFTVTEKLKFTSFAMDLNESPLGASILSKDGFEIYAESILPSVLDIRFVGEGDNWYITEYDGEIVSAKELSAYYSENSSELLWRIKAEGIGSTELEIINNDLKKTLTLTLESLPSEEDDFVLTVTDTKLEDKTVEMAEDLPTENTEEESGKEE